MLLIPVGCTVSTPLPTPPSVGSPAASTIVISRESSTHLPETQPSLTASSTTPTPTVTTTVPPTTPTITPTPQPTGTETPVPIPTPPGVVRREQVLWLLETNNGCQLPCWWGITLEQTEWPLAKEFLSRFDQSISQTSSTLGLVYYEVSIPLPPEIFIEDQTILGILVQNGIVERIRIHLPFIDIPPGYLTSYTLSVFLTAYGQPTEVRLSTSPAPFEHDELPFVVVLFYADRGIAALYGINGARQGDMVHGCPQQEPVRSLELWSPSLDFTFEQMISRSAVFNTEYLSLEESTEMDVATFYETFKNADNTTCLETPADLWR